MARNNPGKLGFVAALGACALFAGCSLIVDSRLADSQQDSDSPRRDGAAPLPEGPDRPEIQVALHLETPAVWPGGELSYGVEVVGFELREDRMGQGPIPGQGHYMLSLHSDDFADGLELYRGAEQQNTITFMGNTDDAGSILPGYYTLVLRLLNNLGEPIHAAADADLIVCGPTVRHPDCGPVKPPPTILSCAPQDTTCTPSCPPGQCDECLFQKCEPDQACVQITHLDPVEVTYGSKVAFELTVDNFRLYHQSSWPEKPYAPDQGDVLIGVGSNSSPFQNIMNWGAKTGEFVLLEEHAPTPGAYVLRFKLLRFDGVEFIPAREACWPIKVTNETIPPPPL